MLLPALALLPLLPGGAVVELRPSSVVASFNPPRLDALTDNNPQTMMVSQSAIRSGDWVRLTVGAPGAPVAVDGVRILQHEQRHCAGCRLELTRGEDPAVGCADDGCWTSVSVVKGPAIYLSTRRQLVRHVRLRATEDAPNTRWHLKDIVIYGAASAPS